ncbi:Mutator family transposase [Actinomyces slackii]
MCADLANRGVADAPDRRGGTSRLKAKRAGECDGLTGLPEAIEATWPDSVVPTCVVHLIRSSMRFVSYGDRKKVAAALRPIYTAPSQEAAWKALEDFASSPLGGKYPETAATWERAWERFTPFLAFPPALRRVIYTTNSIESLNYQLRKVTKSRGQFPSDEAAVKLLWLTICDIEDKRAHQRAKEAGKRAPDRRAKGHLIEGQTTTSWTQALAQLTTAYPDRINPYL